MNILMAQVGCFVPCDKASISVRDCIFARVGAGDCQVSPVTIYLKIETHQNEMSIIFDFKVIIVFFILKLLLYFVYYT